MPILPRLNQFRNLSTPPFTTKQSVVLLLTQTAHRISSGKCLYHFKNAMLSCVRPFVTPWTVARQATLSMGFSRQEYWSGLPCPLQGIFPTGIKTRSATLQGNSLLSEPPRTPKSGLEWVAYPFSRGIPNPGIKPESLALRADSFPAELPGKP